MKTILAFMLYFAITFSVQAALVVTAADIEIRFPDADPSGAGAWIIITPKTINYWDATETPGTHNPKCKLGDQTWRAWLQEENHSLGGVEFIIAVLALPTIAGGPGPARRMELRFYVRDIVNAELRGISPASPVNYIDIIGKPGQPQQIGE